MDEVTDAGLGGEESYSSLYIAVEQISPLLKPFFHMLRECLRRLS
jgi:hypothetical protein